MAKKTIKERTKELFLEFLKTNGFGTYNDGFMSSHYAIRKPKSSENQNPSDYYAEDILDTNIDNIAKPAVFFSFMTDALKKGEHEIALYQAIKKTPKPNNYSFDSHVNSIINVLYPYKKTLFEYVARPKFLESSWKKIESVFQVLDSQEHRIAIIEAMFQTKTFTSLDTQKEIYNIVQNHIRNPSKFNSYFTRIDKVQENQSVIDFIETPSVIVIGFTAEKLIGANLNTQVSSSSLVEAIRNISETLKNKNSNDLNIINTLMDHNKDTKQYSLHIVCPQSAIELNKIVFDRIINDLSRLNTWEEISKYAKDESREQLIKECKAIHLHNTLGDTLNTSEEKVKKTKNKI